MEDSSTSSPVVDVSLRVLICGGQTLTLNIKRHTDTRLVYQRVLEELNLGHKAANYCALFEMIEVCLTIILNLN
jgi:hypothetical protein